MEKQESNIAPIKVAVAEQVQRALKQAEEDYKLALESLDRPSARLKFTLDSYMPIVIGLSKVLEILTS